MKVNQAVWRATRGWESSDGGGTAPVQEGVDLVLVFGGRAVLSRPEALEEVRTRWPDALTFGCSTAGEIHGDRVEDDTLVATTIQFRRTLAATYSVACGDDSFAAGVELARKIDCDSLTNLVVLSDGLHINGTELVRGLSQGMPSNVVITGGLAADGDRFQETFVVVDGKAQTRIVAALAFYGDSLRLGCGSLGGWDQFGLGRRVTKSEGNVLYEIDGKSALSLYKHYLGEHAKDLPASGLLFPLAIRPEIEGNPLVRTILSVDEDSQSLTFAGDIPMGWYVQLMKANFDRLVDGALGAAQTAARGLGGEGPAELALLISCVGRKLILKQRVEEEVEAVREVLGPQACLAGFYSYGEISPFSSGTRCELHNQTMTITTLREV